MDQSANKYPIKVALVSVSDKTGIENLVGHLREWGVEIISSGGTAKYLEGFGLKTTPIQEWSKNPEAFGGRMKTLSFHVSSGLLFRRDHQEDCRQAKELGVNPIDLVICNLYPFKQAAENNEGWPNLVEQIDIGGPTMIRAAAKNHQYVASITNPNQYQDLIDELKVGRGTTTLEMRKKWALQAFEHTAQYDATIVSGLYRSLEVDSPIVYGEISHSQKLRYGENPHQEAFVSKIPFQYGLMDGEQLQGKELSYNNYLDAEAALASCMDLKKLIDGSKSLKGANAVTIVKHQNPCGQAIGDRPLAALTSAWSGDPVSSFGGILCFSGVVDSESARFLKDKFIEVIVASRFTDEARELFIAKKNLRLIELDYQQLDKNHNYNFRSLSGGMIFQSKDQLQRETVEWKTIQSHQADVDMELVQFGIVSGKHFKSNAINLVMKVNGIMQVIGAGMGNPNRLISIEQACQKARDNGFDDLGQAILVSDAFFPFADNIQLATKYGIKTIIQPGGSLKDNEVIEACQEQGIALGFTGIRHFNH